MAASKAIPEGPAPLPVTKGSKGFDEQWWPLGRWLTTLGMAFPRHVVLTRGSKDIFEEAETAKYIFNS